MGAQALALRLDARDKVGFGHENLRVLLPGHASLFWSLWAAEPETRLISGPGFVGQIFAPSRVHEDVSSDFLGHDREMWTPTEEVVWQAEKALPAAVAAWTRHAPSVAGPNFPTACPAKNGTNLRFSSAPSDDRPDSVIDGHNFLRDVEPHLPDLGGSTLEPRSTEGNISISFILGGNSSGTAV
ncbi:MAG: hypothetical protein WDO13_19735 [Verrucomicrobiota bacterium]